MKILCVSDIHGDQKTLIKVRDYVVDNGIGCVFLLGDYSVGFKDPQENKIDVEYAIDLLKEDAKVYALPGNCDQKFVIDIFEKNGVNFHEKAVTIDGIRFIGLGGSNSTPFGTPFELSENEIREKLDSVWNKSKAGKTIVLTHFPPKDTKCDMIPGGAHVGSSALRKFLEEKQPIANVSSHIHESAGKDDLIGKTRVLNVGMLSHGNAVVIDPAGPSISHVKLSLG